MVRGGPGKGRRTTGDTSVTGGKTMDFANVTQAVRRWQERQRMRQELRQLSDRDLADIGLTRDTIDEVVRGEIVRSRMPGLYISR